MSYQVLARKWRPGNFDELVGQAHVLRALSSALDNERLHHAYLFTGTRGVGKTTISRILARCLNCEQGISSKPCGTCSACMEINEGRFVDLIEVDAASRTKVEDTRELLENVQYRPTRGRYKVYLIDEVHMLSNHSFNALLKTLEEPPPHVVFLLATTDPQKLPATVLSRCLQFHLKNMQPEDISKHLAHILDTESIENELPALESIAWSAKGSMRDALSLLDQAIAFGDGKVTDTDVREMLGTIDRDQVYRIIEAVADNDGAKCMAIIEDLSQFAPDYDDVLADLLSVLHRVALIQQIPDASLATQDQQAITHLAEIMPAEDVQLFYQLALHGRRDLPLAPDRRSGFEMCMLRLMSFRPASTVGVSPVKKSESSSHQAVATADVTSVKTEQPPKIPKVQPVQQVETIVKPDPEPVVEKVTVEAPSLENEIPDFAITDSEHDENHFDDPREQQVSDAKSVQVERPKKDYISSPIRSPLVRDHQKIEQPQSEVITETVEPSNEDWQAPVEQEVSEPNEPDISDTSQVSLASTESDPVSFSADDVEFPALANICQENWYCVINKADISGVTEQMALNSQFMNFNGEHFELSLNHHVRSMVNPEHINKLTAAINTLYNGSFTVAITDNEPEYETPRQRRERIQAERHQAACDNLNSDPQVQGLLKTFGANLDLDSVETLLPPRN